jgi:hypothetical protein
MITSIEENVAIKTLLLGFRTMETIVKLPIWTRNETRGFKYRPVVKFPEYKEE